MTHRTQLYLDEMQYHYLRDLARRERKSIAQIIRDWIEEKRKMRVVKNFRKDPLASIRGLFDSGDTSMARDFDGHLYGMYGTKR